MEALRCTIMRGGAGNAIFPREEDIPPPGPERDRLILRVFGSHDKRQIDGLGGADPLTSKLVEVASAAAGRTASEKRVDEWIDSPGTDREPPPSGRVVSRIHRHTDKAVAGLDAICRGQNRPAHPHSPNSILGVGSREHCTTGGQQCPGLF